ncbi:transcriptional regulator with XRE-family HTH domain [Streptomyces aurantiacus]|uniref:helix-turn-helix transcriptional regulator n=1 Tax=Streptomyces aurantiacus TaxID=47760 RepID=UPI00278E977A|nr:helix-turn-helix transcriptional regulator [Streptomyces aurantiacus]MDQ0777161.1 transcriptional regulator with XRE-family HTH domain [Streptomyces aurantiacus]
MSGALGTFLARRRASVDPGSVGLAATGLRRVPGLRREEVAVRAGVSADYYTRLEQGRERHPSPQVLGSLSRALLLDDDSREHLFRLANAMLPSGAAPTKPQITAELRLLLDQLHDAPALVLTDCFDVLARNALAEKLYAGFTIKDNSARMCFLDRAGRDFYAPWPRVAAGIVAGLRFAAGQRSNEQRVAELVDELRARSVDFDALWQSHAVGAKRNETKEFHHPAVGRLDLYYQSFDVREAGGQQLVVMSAAPGSLSASRLAELQAVPLDS